MTTKKQKATISVTSSLYRAPRPSHIMCGYDKYGRSIIWDVTLHEPPKEIKDAQDMAILYPIFSALSIGLIVFIIASSL